MLHFVHVRKRTAFFEPIIVNPEEKLFTEKYVVSVKGGVTVAYKFNDEAKRIEYSTARCSKKDNYCKKTGRDLACSRQPDGSIELALVDYSSLPDGKPTYKNISAYFNTLFKEA